MAAFHEEIVFAPSEDQRWMAGVLMRPNDNARRRIGVICIHGATSAFYSPLHIHLGRALAERGYLYVSGNTRAHDIASDDGPWPMTARPEALADWRLGGNGWYRFEELAHDVAGWIEYVVGQGVEQAVLVGHSAGVAWATYFQAQRQDPRVVGLILVSGSGGTPNDDPARVQLAEELVAQGKGSAAMPVQEGTPAIFSLQSADSVVDWERVAGPFVAEGHTPWLASIRTPILATMGTMDVFYPNPHEALQGMRARAAQAPRFDVQVVDGADHLYAGQERDLAQVILKWLDQLPAAQKVTRRRWWGKR